MAEKNKLEIKFLPITSVIPYEKNPKKHSPAQVEKISKQINAVGWTQPIIVDKKMCIIAGHGRLLAAKLLGLKQIPVFIADHLTKEQVIAYRIADNKVAESSWDFELLKFDMNDLYDKSFDMTLTGFGADDFNVFIESLSDKSENKNVSFTAKTGSKELDSKDFQNFNHTCPKCGFGFDE